MSYSDPAFPDGPQKNIVLADELVEGITVNLDDLELKIRWLDDFSFHRR